MGKKEPFGKKMIKIQTLSCEVQSYKSVSEGVESLPPRAWSKGPKGP